MFYRSGGRFRDVTWRDIAIFIGLFIAALLVSSVVRIDATEPLVRRVFTSLGYHYAEAHVISQERCGRSRSGHYCDLYYVVANPLVNSKGIEYREVREVRGYVEQVGSAVQIAYHPFFIPYVSSWEMLRDDVASLVMLFLLIVLFLVPGIYEYRRGKASA